uniref:Uncharacterized protein n=1 Tax=Arundo donax TaxID=35708 RepID=A0A0A9HP48_ARUDO
MWRCMLTSSLRLLESTPLRIMKNTARR